MPSDLHFRESYPPERFETMKNFTDRAMASRCRREMRAGLAIQLDCNRAVGRWEARPTSTTSGSISFSTASMTRAACLPGSMDTRIASDLELVRIYTLDGDRLNLALEGNGSVYTWRRMAQ